jgi:AcrR family transcriptional regulator
MTTQDTRSRGARLPRSARRAQLLVAAQEVFVENGYHSAAMDDIAERAGVSKPVLYQHFPGKLELYLAILDMHNAELVASVGAAMRAHPENKDRVAAAISAYYEFVDRDDAAFRLVFESDLTNDPLVKDRVDLVERTVSQTIADIITEDAGLDRARAELLGVALAGMAQVSARAWLQGERPVPREQAAALISQLAWRGIGAFPLTGSPTAESAGEQPG